MANDHNLRPFQSVDEARAAGKKGGVASGEARRKKRAIREWVSEIGETLPPEIICNALKAKGMPVPDDMTLDALVVRSMYFSAAGGNVQAFKALAEVQDRHAAVDAEETPDALSAALMAIAEGLNNGV